MYAPSSEHIHELVLGYPPLQKQSLILFPQMGEASEMCFDEQPVL